MSHCLQLPTLALLVVTLGCQGPPAFRALDINELRARADRGDPAAQRQLGEAFERGEAVEKSMPDALMWYRKAADQGHAAAQNDLGSIYQFGVGVRRDYTEAIKWFRMAADRDFAVAYSNLGFMYDKGLGVPADKSRAAQLYRTAAEKGSVEGMLNLGVSYWRREGVARDLPQAYMWLDMARGYARQTQVKEVHERARAAWFDVGLEMTAPQNRTARRLMKDWLANVRKFHQQNEAGGEAEHQGDLRRAKDLYHQARVTARTGSLGTSYDSQALYNWGRVTGYLGDHAEAEAALAEALALEESSSGPTSRLTSMRLFELARLNHDTGDPADAARYYASAIPIVRALDVERTDPIALANELAEYAQVLQELGKTEEASAMTREAERIRGLHPGKTARFSPKRYR